MTRKFPPAVGGMETVSRALATEFTQAVPTTLLAWGGSQKWLPLVMLKFLTQTLYHCYFTGVSHVHLGDGVLAPLGVIIRALTRTKVSVTIHGLDITYQNRLYQSVIPACVARLDAVICISNATKEACLSRQIPQSSCHVIPWGVYAPTYQPVAKATGRPVLLTVGRLVRRKGVEWFIENVMPKLRNRYDYVIVGDGEERAVIEALILKQGLQTCVKLTGRISDDERDQIYASAAVFVMPNIPVQGNIEGFGIVAVEASARGLPVVASRLDGIADAVIDGKTGVLVEPKSVMGFVSAIDYAKASLNRADVSKATVSAFSWQVVVNKYIETIR